MVENEHENPETATVQSDSQTSQPLAADQASHTAPEAGAEVARPDEVRQPDEPQDGDGYEAVTVVIMQTVADNSTPAMIALQSLEKNLTECNAAVKHIALNADVSLEQQLLDLLPDIHTERIVLMTDRMIVLQPITLAHIALKKDSQGMPIMVRHSVLCQFLPWKLRELPQVPLWKAYADYVLHDIVSLHVGDWKTDPWVLPVVSDNPSVKALETYVPRKWFLCVLSERYPESLMQWLIKYFQ